MRTVIYREYGGPEVISIEEVAKPAPKSNEVLIRVHACSVNDWDLGLLKGDVANRLLNGLRRPKRILTVGSDIAGEVESVGPGVTSLQAGDRIYGDLSGYRFGGFADYVCAREKDLAPMPDGMSFEQAAAIPQAGVLATQALLDMGKVTTRHKVLINGAGGGVGTLGIQVLKAIGDIDVTGVDSGIKLDLMRRVGYDHVIDYTREDFTDGENKYDLIIDAKTNRPPWRYLRALKPNGIYATVGGRLGRLLQFALLAPILNLFNSKTLKLVTLRTNKDLAYYNKLFVDGKLKPLIDGPYSLEELPEVFERYARGLQLGKMVIKL